MLKARDRRQWRVRDHVLVIGPALLVAGAAFVVARAGPLNVDAKARALLS